MHIAQTPAGSLGRFPFKALVTHPAQGRRSSDRTPGGSRRNDSPRLRGSLGTLGCGVSGDAAGRVDTRNNALLADDTHQTAHARRLSRPWSGHVPATRPRRVRLSAAPGDVIPREEKDRVRALAAAPKLSRFSAARDTLVKHFPRGTFRNTGPAEWPDAGTAGGLDGRSFAADDVDPTDLRGRDGPTGEVNVDGDRTAACGAPSRSASAARPRSARRRRTRRPARPGRAARGRAPRAAA